MRLLTFNIVSQLRLTYVAIFFNQMITRDK